MAPLRRTQRWACAHVDGHSGRGSSDPTPARPSPEGQHSRTTALAENGHDLLVKIKTFWHDRRTLGPTHPRVEKQTDDRRIAASSKILPLTGFEQLAEFIGPSTGGGSSGILGDSIPDMGLASSSSYATAHSKNAWRPR